MAMADAVKDRRSTSPATAAGYGKWNFQTREKIIEAIVNSDAATVKKILITDPWVLEDTFSYTLPGDDNETEILTPLMFAAALGNYEITNLILHEGSEPLDTELRKYIKNNAFLLATSRNQLEVAKAILNKGDKNLLESRNSRDETPFLVAVRNKAANMVDFLVDNGADVNARDKYGLAAIHIASEFGQSNIVEILLNHKADINAQDIEGRTAIHLASEFGHSNIVEILLNHEADINAQDSYGDTAIHFASKLDNVDVVKKIYEAGGTHILELRGHREQTPLLAAADTGKTEIFRFLINEGAGILARDRDKNTALHLAAKAKSIEIVRLLLEKESGLRDLPNTAYQTALLIAAARGNLEIVEYLHKQGADIEAEDYMGDTPLLNASYSGDCATVKYLVKAGADLMKTNDVGGNALHVACLYSHADVVDTLLDCPADLLKRAAIAEMAFSRETPLCVATRKRDFPIILKLLGSKVYFPESPIQDDVYKGPELETRMVRKWLLNWLYSKKEQDQETPAKKKHYQFEYHIKAVIYWAVLNGMEKLINLAMWKGQNPSLDQEGDRKGVTWLHVAALGGHAGLLDRFPEWRCDIMAEATKKTTPLHLAAKQGCYDMVWKLLTCLESENTNNRESSTTGRQRVLQAIVQGTEEEETLISLAAARKDSQEHLRLECSLWDKMFEIIKGDQKFFEQPHSDVAELVMGVAAWRHTAGEKKYFEKLMGLVSTGRELTPLDRSPLRFAVFHKFPMALWWLLSSGGYFGEKHIRECEDTLKYCTSPRPGKEKVVQEVIEDLLRNPPPVRPSLKDDKRSPHFQFRRPDSDSRKGTVLDLFVTDRRDITFKLKRSDMVDIIYDRGPEKIMSVHGYSELQSLRKRLLSQREDTANQKSESGEPFGQDFQPAVDEKPVDEPSRPGERSKKKSGKGHISESGWMGSRERQSKFRWIHIPVNDLCYVEELMVRISLEKRKDNVHHRHLTDFVQRSWSELPAGGRNHYMKPHCQSYTNAQDASTGSDVMKSKPHSSRRNTEVFALYMPYLFWGQQPSGKNIEDSNEKRPIQKPYLRQNVSNKTKTDCSVNMKPISTAQNQEFKALAVNVDPSKASTRETALSDTLTTKTEERVGQEFHTGEEQDTGNQQESIPTEDKQVSTKKLVHKSITLDQYYYVSLHDTWSRDCDQVLGRYFERRRREQETRDEKKNKKGEGDSKAIYDSELDTQGERPPGKTIAKVGPTQILMVNQLWLWILDRDTIITSTTEEPEDAKNTFLQRVLINLRTHGNTVSSIEHIAEYIIATATSLFNVQDIEIDDSDEGKRSPLEIFRESIQRVRDDETKLFGEFRDSLKSPKQDNSSTKKSLRTHSRSKVETRQRSQTATPTSQRGQRILGLFFKEKNRPYEASNESAANASYMNGPPHNGLRKWWNSLRQLAPDNPYEDISMETGLLCEVKDILDELNILKNLAQDQKTVDDLWKSISKVEGYRHLTPSETKEDIESMIEDAKSIQSAIHTLLDLKQKEATILEAQATRRQSDAVMVFTMVTIIFLPASFLTSMFALNVTDFPHEDGTLTYRGWWIFPIIFGVSVPVSIIFMLIAFNASGIKKIWRTRKENRNPKRLTQESKNQAEGIRRRLMGPGNDGNV